MSIGLLLLGVQKYGNHVARGLLVPLAVKGAWEWQLVPVVETVLVRHDVDT